MNTRFLRLRGALLASLALCLGAPAQDPSSPATPHHGFPAGVARASGLKGWWATKWTPLVGAGFKGEPQNAPADDVLVRHTHYVASYDPHRRITIWAAYSVDKGAGIVADEESRSDKKNKAFKRPSGFSVEPLVREAAQKLGVGLAQDDDYGDAEDPRWPVPTGLDPKKISGDPRYIQRGHIVPNNAMKCLGDVDTGILAQKESFSLANIVPESNEFNAPSWSGLEAAVLRWAKHYDRIWVIGGPVVSSNPPVIMEGRQHHDPRHVVVPDAVFYVLLVKDGAKIRTAAFLMPNRPEDLDYRNYAVSVDDIEAATGLNFFPELGEPAVAEHEKGIWIIGNN